MTPAEVAERELAHKILQTGSALFPTLQLELGSEFACAMASVCIWLAAVVEMPEGNIMKPIRLMLTLILVALFGSGSAWADHRHGGHLNFGFYLGAPWGWPGYYYPPPAYYYPPVVAVPMAPPVYIEQGTAAPAPSQSNYWYYCAAAKSYYPYVKECAGGWQRVAPQPEQGR